MDDLRAALNLILPALNRIRQENDYLPRASWPALRALTAVAPKQPARVNEREATAAVVPNAPVVIPATTVLPIAQAVVPAAPALSKAERMAPLRDRVAICTKCPHLAASRTQTVFGVGNLDAEVMFVGEAPGADEDLKGEPFVGAAGQLLTKIIVAMGLTRADVFIANILKCRPDMPPNVSGNRPPTADEMATCLPYLEEQIDIIQPRVLVALGATALKGLLNVTEPIGQLRGRWQSYRGTPLMATYHPSYLLRNQAPAEKRKVWEDMLQVLERLGHPISERQQNFFR